MAYRLPTEQYVRIKQISRNKVRILSKNKYGSNEQMLHFSVFTGAIHKRRRVGGGGEGFRNFDEFRQGGGEGAEKFDVDNIFIRYCNLWAHFVAFLGSCKSARERCSALKFSKIHTFIAIVVAS